MKPIEAILQEIDSIYTAYNQISLDPKQRPIHLQDLCKAIEYYYANGLTITVKAIKTDNPKLFGMYVRKGNEVVIIHALPDINNPLPNYCYQRWIVAKELMQFIMDNEESYTNKPGELIESIVKSSGYVVPKSSLETQKHADEIAKYFGSLLLFPFDEIRKAKDQLKQASSKDDFYDELAQEYRIPKVCVEWLLDDSIFDFFNKAYPQNLMS